MKKKTHNKRIGKKNMSFTDYKLNYHDSFINTWLL